MNVLFVLELELDSHTGGTIYGRRLVEALRRRGHAVEVRLCREGEPGAELEAWADVMLWDGMSLISGLARWPSLLDWSPHAAVVHTPFSEPHLRDEPWLPVPPEELPELERRLFGAMSAIIVPSDRVRRTLVERYGVPPGAVSVHEPCSSLSLERMPPRSLARDAWRFVTIGSVTRRKCQHLLLEALPGVRKEVWRGRSWSLELIGRTDAEPGYVGEIRERAARLGLSSRISLGARSEEDLLLALSRSHAHLFPSLDEGYGMAVYETLCAGIPTIFSESACALGPRYTSIPPLAPESGVEAWSSAIELFLAQAELWEQRAASRREKPRSWDDTAAEIERLLLEHSAPRSATRG